jgi:hypothetical protein
MVDANAPSVFLLLIAINSHMSMHMPEIKASLDKNNSQRIGILV